MPGSTRELFDAFPDPSPALVPIGPAQLDRVDDALHYGWAWHRHHYAFRKGDRIRILDAGCGTGLSTLGLARLNPGAAVVGVDASPVSLGLARQRAEAVRVAGLEFVEHDLDTPLPPALGTFDFVVARGLLGTADDPSPILATLARALDPRGLLLATFPSAAGRMPARQLVRALDAIVPAGAAVADRAEAGLDLLGSLRPDHPIRRFDASRHGPNGPNLEAFVATYLNDRETDWTLEAALGAVEASGLRCLYVADRGAWRPDRVFGPAIPGRLRDLVAGLDEPDLARLKDALDITIHPDSYTLYACPAAYEPPTPAWPEDLGPDALDRLVPHATGLATPFHVVADPSADRGRATYRTANGALGELEARSDRALRLVDGVRTVGTIEVEIGEGAEPEPPEARRTRWLDLANLGFVILEAPDPRQNVDCIHLGRVEDRLDCACPRRWVRGCEVHGHCTIATVGPADPKSAAYGQALGRIGISSAIACDHCADYSPEG